MIGAHIGRAAGATGLRVGIAEGLVVYVTAFDRGGDTRLAVPGTAGLATVPRMCKRKRVFVLQQEEIYQ